MFLDTANLVKDMFDKFVEAKMSLQKYCTKVMICQMVGLKFEKYYNSDPFPNSQRVINEGMPLLNHSILKCNKNLDLNGTLFHSK